MFDDRRSNIIRHLCVHYSVVVMFTALIGTAYGRLIVIPVDTEVVAGQTVRIGCSTNYHRGATWDHVPVGASSKNWVSMGNVVVVPYDERFTLSRKDTPEERDYHLTISDAKLEDAGAYRCSEEAGSDERKQVQLVVLEAPPICHSEEIVGVNSCGIPVQDHIYVSCSVRYAGNRVPFVNCTGSDLTSTEVDIVETGRVSYHIGMAADLLYIGAPRTCHTTTSNISSLAFKQNISFVLASLERKTIHDAGTVTCFVNSSTICSYKWTQQLVEEGESVKVVCWNQTIFISRPGLYQCSADCPLLGNACTVQPVEVEYVTKLQTVSPRDMDNAAGATRPKAGVTLATIISIVSVVSVIIVIVVVIIVIYKRRRMNNENKKLQRREKKPLTTALSA